MLNLPVQSFNKKDLPEIFKKMIDKYIESHKLSLSAHEEIMAMVHSDKDVAYFFYKREMALTYKLTEVLKQNGFNSEDLSEKVHIIIGIIDNLSHEIVYHKHEGLDYDKMKTLVINSIVNLLC